MKGKLKQLVTTKRLKRSGAIVGIAFIFLLGISVGNGTLQGVLPGHFSSRTGLPDSLSFSSINQVYTALKQNYNGTLTASQVMDGLKHGLAESTGDPYTEYFTASEAKAFSGQLQGTFSGIGAQLEQDTNKNIVVVAPLDGSPAASAGIRAKDIIATIDGKSTSGMSVTDALTKIRGAKGSKVTLGIIRNGDQALTISITRDNIQVPTATSKIVDGNIGYIQVSQFSDDTFPRVQQAVSTFQQNGVKKVILDLRDDPGGEVTVAQNIASLWLPDNALIMQDRRGSTVVDDYKATGNNPLKGMPTVVLVNAGSASASEITALALRENNAAVIYGEKSYGKGVVQQVLPFSDGSQLKVTVSSWYSPKGNNINHKGITPDKTVALSEADYSAGNDPQLDAATTYLQSK